jgi:hypothetical protein
MAFRIAPPLARAERMLSFQISTRISKARWSAVVSKNSPAWVFAEQLAAIHPDAIYLAEIRASAKTSRRASADAVQSEDSADWQLSLLKQRPSAWKLPAA